MKISIFLFFSFSSLLTFAQKFTVIENKGENVKYFDYNDPNSFVGVLINNLSSIPGMIVNNQFQGVYNEKSLNEIGVDPSTMLKFELAPQLRIYRPFSEDTMVIIKTNQSLQAYLDSVKNDEDFEMIFNINRDKLEKYWNTATENSPVLIRTPYYFDVRNLSALLIEEKDSVMWVHFVKSLPTGKSLISLSLTEAQLKETDCFLFWQFLTEEQSEIFKMKYKQKRQEDYILEDGWQKVESNYLSGLDYNFYFYEEGCSQSIDFGNVLYPFCDLFSQHILMKGDPKKIEIQEVKYVQNIGDILGIYRPWKEDTFNIIKTSQPFEIYIDSMSLDPENEELLGIDRDVLRKWWDSTEINFPVRKNPNSVLLWRDAPNSKLAISFKIYEGDSIPVIRDVVLYTKQSGNLIPIRQCSDEITGYENFVLNYLETINLNVSVTENWLDILNVKAKKSKFSSLQKSLKLINKSIEF